MMRSGNLITVNGTIYEYMGYDEDLKFHKGAIIEIDDEGILTHTHRNWYFSTEELANNEMDLTLAQVEGLVEHFIRQDYALTAEEMAEIVEDIVCRCFAVTGIPKIEEMADYIAKYMER